MIYYKKISQGHIREATKRDVESILKMINSNPTSFGDEDLAYQKNHIEEMISPPHKTYIFEVGEEKVGFVSSKIPTLDPDHGALDLDINSDYVSLVEDVMSVEKLNLS